MTFQATELHVNEVTIATKIQSLVRFRANNHHIVRQILHWIPVFIVLSMILALPAFSQKWMSIDKINENASFNEIQNRFEEYWKDKTPGKGEGWKPFKRMEYFWSTRLNPDGTYPDASRVLHEWINYKANQKPGDEILADQPWTFVGPTRRPAKDTYTPQMGLGRLNCIAFDNQNPNILWAGAATGGVWKSTNAGATWFTFPFTEVLSIGISDIAVSQSDPNIVYAATGDADAAGFFGISFSYSVGVLKTTDGGATWQETALKSDISGRVLINKLIVHPQNPSIVYAAANTGLYLTTNGGAKWSQISPNTCRDLEMKPGDPNVLFGAFIENNTYTLRKYVQDENKFSSPQTVGGATRIALAVTPAIPGTVYALCSDMEMGFLSVMKTVDGGSTWNIVADKSNSPNYLNVNFDGSQSGGQGMYDLCIAASPSNANEVYIGGVNIWKSIDGGKKWTIVGEWTGDHGIPYVHADQHALEFNKSGTLFSCNDGGLNKTSNGGTQWTDLTDGLQITQFYRSGTAAKNANIIVAGSQDNGTALYNGTTWRTVLGGDGMDCLIDPNNQNNIIVSLYYGNFYLSKDGGITFNSLINQYMTQEQGEWVAPIVIDPKTSSTFYAGYKNVWKMTNYGQTKTKISNLGLSYPLKALAIAPSDPNTIYAVSGYTSNGYKIFATYNGGSTWSEIYSGSNPITALTVHPTTPKRLWATIGGFVSGTKVMEINNTTKKNVSGTLPNVPVNCIVYQNNAGDRLYIGTDIGVFTRQGQGDWKQLAGGLPNVIVCDLDINYLTGKLRAATYGRGIWETKVNDCNLAAPEIEKSGPTGFCDGGSVTLTPKTDFTSYSWSNGARTKAITVKASGTYSLVVTDSKGCEATSEAVTVEVYPVPDLRVKLTGDNPFCTGDTISLSVNIGYTDYTWSNGMNGRTIKITQPGKYAVEGTTAKGCRKVSDSIEITVLPQPAKPTVEKQGEQLVCSDAISYQWYLDGSPITGATGKIIKPVKSGKYFVQVSDANGCRNQSNPIDINLSDVADNSGQKTGITIRPNPNNGDFIIESYFEEPEEIEIIITDMLGNKISNLTSITGSGVFTKDLSIGPVPPGIYVLELKSGKKHFYVKIVKQ